MAAPYNKITIIKQEVILTIQIKILTVKDQGKNATVMEEVQK